MVAYVGLCGLKDSHKVRDLACPLLRELLLRVLVQILLWTPSSWFGCCWFSSGKGRNRRALTVPERMVVGSSERPLSDWYLRLNLG